MACAGRTVLTVTRATTHGGMQVSQFIMLAMCNTLYLTPFAVCSSAHV